MSFLNPRKMAIAEKKGEETKPFDFVPLKFSQGTFTFNFSPSISSDFSPLGTNRCPFVSGIIPFRQ